MLVCKLSGVYIASVCSDTWATEQNNKLPLAIKWYLITFNWDRFY